MKLSNTEVYDRLHQALLALGAEGGASAVADTALKTARRVLVLSQASVLMKMDEAEEAPVTPAPDGA